MPDINSGPALLADYKSRCFQQCMCSNEVPQFLTSGLVLAFTQDSTVTTMYFSNLYGLIKSRFHCVLHLWLTWILSSVQVAYQNEATPKHHSGLASCDIKRIVEGRGFHRLVAVT